MIGRMVRFVLRAFFAIAGAFMAVSMMWSSDVPRDGDTRQSESGRLYPFMWRWLFRAAVLGVVAGLAGLIVAASGIVPIKASSGHWAITEAFLQFAKRRSVTTYSLTVNVPNLDEARLITMGAGHYDFGCRPCHGSPALPQPMIAAHMLPRPPNLRHSISKYDPAELFFIVKHGIKLTGMPAWPALQRDDEVWAMVAFLRRLPHLDAREYESLAGTWGQSASVVHLEQLMPDEPPDAVATSCSRCHGLDGMGRGIGAFPRLAGQRAAYLLASLQAYARGERHSGIMQSVAAGLDPGAMQQIAQYYSTRNSPTRSIGSAAPAAALEAAIEEGRAIATTGLPGQLVPACVECHGPGVGRRNPHYPVLAGQYAAYIVQQLSLFQAGHRGGTPYHHIMHRIAGRLTNEQIRAVAAYFASLPAPPTD